MGNYKIEDFHVGMETEFKVVISEEMMTAFLSMYGDKSRIHMEDDYAISKGYSGRVVYGMLYSSFFSKLIGVDLPGDNGILQEIQISFLHPVYVGDTLIIRGRVEKIHEAVSVIIIKGEILNQNNKKVCKGNIRVGVN